MSESSKPFQRRGILQKCRFKSRKWRARTGGLWRKDGWTESQRQPRIDGRERTEWANLLNSFRELGLLELCSIEFRLHSVRKADMHLHERRRPSCPVRWGIPRARASMMAAAGQRRKGVQELWEWSSSGLYWKKIIQNRKAKYVSSPFWLEKQNVDLGNFPMDDI